MDDANEFTLDQAQQWVAKYAPKPYYVERYRGCERDYLPELFRRLAPLKPGVACDIGPGWGTTIAWLANRDWSITALDNAQPGQYLTRFALDRLGLQCGVGVEYVQHDIFAGPPNRHFDLIVMSQVLPHLKWRPDRAVGHVAAMLKQDGHLFVVVLDSAKYPNIQPPFGTDWTAVPEFGTGPACRDSVVCMYTPDTLRSLLETAFSDVSVSTAEGSTCLFAHARSPKTRGAV